MDFKEKKIMKEEKGRRAFNNSKTISKYNKDLVNQFIEDMSDESRSGDRPYEFNGSRFIVLKLLGEKLLTNKKFNEITMEEVRSIGNTLKSNIIVKKNGEEYSKSYKKQIFKIINSFYEYLFGTNSEKFNSMFFTKNGRRRVLRVGEIKETDMKPKPILNEEEISILVKETENYKYRFFFAVMFEGGFRIEEFLNIKFKDIEKNEEFNSYSFKVTEGTKTSKSRVVSLTIFPGVVEEYLNKRKNDLNIDDIREEYIYPMSSQQMNRVIKKQIEQILGRGDFKDFHNHSFRHSSATHFALHFNEAQMDDHFGWAYGSTEKRAYIQRSNAISESKINKQKNSVGVKNNEKLKKAYSLEINNLKEELTHRTNQSNSLIFETKNKMREMYNLFDEEIKLLKQINLSQSRKSEINKKLLINMVRRINFDKKDGKSKNEIIEEYSNIEDKELALDLFEPEFSHKIKIENVEIPMEEYFNEVKLEELKKIPKEKLSVLNYNQLNEMNIIDLEKREYLESILI